MEAGIGGVCSTHGRDNVYNIATRKSDYRRCLDRNLDFIEYFPNITTSNYSALANSDYNSIQHPLSLLSLLYLHRLWPGDGF
jgi:hypothetical protein